MKFNTITEVARVINQFDTSTSPANIKAETSSIVVHPQFAEALYRIEACEYIDVVFYFDRSEVGHLKGITHSGEERGVFASRSPRRPSLIGVTTVKLLGREGNTLLVEGLDALNNTPVIDIKCADTSLFADVCEENPAHISVLKSDPRIEIRNNIERGQTDRLLIKAAQMHGHFCPGLAMGIMAATYAMQQLKAESDGMEGLLAITETNNCFSDGVQFVSGCTFGNNALIFNDLGKTAFTLTRRDGNGLRLCSKPESQQLIKDSFPAFQHLYQKVVVEQNRNPQMLADYKEAAVKRAFGTLQLPFEGLFSIQNVKVEIPAFAPIHDSAICARCGESVMSSRTVTIDGKAVCYTCSNSPVGVLDGSGIH
ncbi:MAG TPA: TrmO family methyltransferase [Prolixibacteraceae bacterium]|nr:TrmO family methyltransferase [Prolixibacteraceae bacterium]